MAAGMWLGQSRAEPDVVYVPTPQAVVDAMLDVAKVKAGDIVYDLGSGDGRIVITAAKKYGARGVGHRNGPGARSGSPMRMRPPPVCPAACVS